MVRKVVLQDSDSDDLPQVITKDKAHQAFKQQKLVIKDRQPERQIKRATLFDQELAKEDIQEVQQRIQVRQSQQELEEKIAMRKS